MRRPERSVEARRARLVAHHHLGRTAADVVQATRDLVGLHSSDPLTPHLALWARVARYRTEALDEALVASRTLWRLHAMRGTLWVAASDEVGVLQAATGAEMAAKAREMLVGWVSADRPDAERWLARLEADLLDAVRERPGVSTRELTAAMPALATPVRVGSGKWTAEVAIATRLLSLLARELRIARTASAGSWRASQYGWTLPEAVEPVAPAEGRARLVARYVERFGPVTTTDVRWWTGLTAARVKRALAETGAVPVAIDGAEAWEAPDAPDDGEPSGVALLAGLDPTPMGYKERAWFLGGHEAALFDTNGNVGPTVWVAGRVVGGWAVKDDGRVVVGLLQDVGREAEAEVTAQAEALTAWLGGTSITPRFRTPLERELTA